MNFYFERIEQSGDCPHWNGVLEWHRLHGYVYLVYLEDKPIGYFYITIFAGLGGIVHFATFGRNIHYWRSGVRKGLEFAASFLDNIFATVPENNSVVLKAIRRMGFVELAKLRSDGWGYILLQYLNCRNDNVT